MGYFLDNHIKVLFYYYLKSQEKNGYSYLIEIDGGINRETAIKAVNSGVEVLVAGTAVFGAQNIAEEVEYYTSLPIDIK